jgi:hypothetical protein
MDGLSASHGQKAIAVRLMRTDAADARRWAASLADIEWKSEALLEFRPGLTYPFAHVLKQGLGNASRVESAAWQEIISALCRKSATETVEALASYVRSLALRSPEQTLDLLTEIETGRYCDRVLSELLHDAPGLFGRTCALYSDEATEWCRVHWDPDRLGHPLEMGMRQWLRDEKVLRWNGRKIDQALLKKWPLKRFSGAELIARTTACKMSDWESFLGTFALAGCQPPKESLPKRPGNLRSRRMKVAVSSPESAVYRCGLVIFPIEPPPTGARNTSSGPIYPATRFTTPPVPPPALS